MNYPGISIIIAVLNEEKHIEKCLDSVIGQKYKGETEILIADGGSSDNTINIIKEYQLKNKHITLIHNEKKIQAAGRNLCAKNSKYDLIAYIDGHSTADENWLKNLVTTYEQHKEMNIFGVGSIYNEASNNAFSKAVNAVLVSFLSGAGTSHFLNSDTVRETENAYACLYNKEIFLKLGGYKEYLATGEDIELNQRAIKNGYKLFVNPNAITFYYRIGNFTSFIKQQYRYGFWRANLIKKGNFSVKPITPALFILFLIAGTIFSQQNAHINEFFNYMLLFYLIVVFYYSAKIGIQKKLSSFLCFIIAVSVHLFYGLGMLTGLIFNNKNG